MLSGPDTPMAYGVGGKPWGRLQPGWYGGVEVASATAGGLDATIFSAGANRRAISGVYVYGDGRSESL